VYLSDFGISKLSLSTSHLTSTGQFVGTLDYIAPEQITGRDVDGRADLYSLGCAAYELLSGSPPFRRDEGFALISAHLTEPPPPLTERRTDLPVAVDLVLAGVMAKAPGKRYETCERFTTDLGRALGLIPGYLELPGSPRALPLTGQPDTQAPEDQLGTPLAIPTALGAYGTSSRPAERPADVTGQRQPAAQDRTWPSGTEGPIAPYLSARSPAAVAGQAAGGQRPAGSPGGPAASGWPEQPSGPGGIMGWDPRTPQAPVRRSRAMIAGVGVAVAAVVAAAATAAVILLGNHHPSGSGSLPPSQTSAPASSSSAPSTAPSSSASSATTPPPSSTAAPTTSPATTSPLSTATASTQAAAVSTLLATGSGSSVTLTDAVNNVGSCTDLSGSIDSINAVRDQRQAEYSQAQSLTTDALQNGTALKSDLTKALSFSLKADDDYLAWAQQQSVSCQPGSPPAHASTAGNKALSYKTLFVGLWNPQAPTYGLPTTSVAKI
jgi:serine/threonine protein kinase